MLKIYEIRELVAYTEKVGGSLRLKRREEKAVLLPDLVSWLEQKAEEDMDLQKELGFEPVVPTIHLNDLLKEIGGENSVVES